ncbi:hypothetical protein [Ruminococcus champanellensis]|jgi:hypothetical protein|uniref:hypothetical protein n=1 Tax=Ruminococcus champanellensis TaxID=1161942 RepID=UPI0026DC089A|nr:hypothetical protein [Ruminococcus champanellensis]
MSNEHRIAVIRNRLEQVDRERTRLEARRAQESSGMTDYLIDLLASAGARLTRELEELQQA